VACTGADEINQAADAAEKVTSDVNQLVADLAQGSQDGDAVEDAYVQRSHTCNPQTLLTHDPARSRLRVYVRPTNLTCVCWQPLAFVSSVCCTPCDPCVALPAVTGDACGQNDTCMSRSVM